MKRLIILMACASLALVGCGNDENITSQPPKEEPSEPDEPEKPSESQKPDVPDEPFVYDYDLDYDAGAFISAYKGTPHKGPHHVPGTVEAEDFDNGQEGVAYHESDDKIGDEDYRGKTDVDVRGSDNASNGYFIGDVQPGEWMNYTVEVDEDGSYSIDTYITKGDGSEGNFYFEVDGRIATRSIEMPLGDWSDFSKKTTAEDLQLKKGRHIIKYYGGTPGNVDKFVFKRTGELKDTSQQFHYPVTKAMTNPLFADFDSPMFNSSLKGRLYTADASAHVWNIDGKEVLYVYASHDMEPAAGCDRMDRYHVFSTEDMVNWTDHGEIMNASTVQKQGGWGCAGFMWAPDCVYNPANKTYYFYFPHPIDADNWNNTWKIGVATSKYPDKEFHVRGYVQGMPGEIDPCVFVDDDGQPYIYNGGGGKCYGGKLNKNDWKKLDGEMKLMSGLDDFHEGTWIHKYNGTYYLTYADNKNGANQLKYATGKSPLGPWTSHGVYVGSTTCDTNHGSVVRFKGRWYAFYHCSDVSGKGNLRSVCVDELFYNPDGTIKLVEQTRGKKR